VPPPRRIGPYEASLSENRERLERAMTLREQRRRRYKALVAAGSVAAVLGVTGLVNSLFWADDRAASDRAAGAVPVVRTTVLVAKSCAKPAELTVATPAAMATAFAAVIAAFQRQPGAPCATFTVVPREASAVAQSLAGPVRPDAWVIDAKLWLQQANSRAGLGLVADEPFASSPIIVAMPEEAAQEAAGSGWARLATEGPGLVLADPATSTVGLLSRAASRATWPAPVLAEVAKRSTSIGGTSALPAAADPARRVATTVTLSELKSYNKANPRARLAAVTPAEGVAPVQYSLVSVADGTVASRVLRALSDFLASNATRDLMAQHEFAGPLTPGTPPPLSQPDFTAAGRLRDTWATLVRPSHAVLAIDTSASTLSRMGGETILSGLSQAAQSGLAGLPDRSTVAVWLYSEHLGPKSEDYRIVAPSAPLTNASHVQSVAKVLGSLKGIVGGRRGLYDTVIAATREAATQAQPGSDSTALVITAGPNDDDFGSSLGAVKAALSDSSVRNSKVRLVIIGVGDGVSSAAPILKEVVALTGGTYRHADNGDELSEAVAAALAGRP
jgi:hypothetical protein